MDNDTVCKNKIRMPDLMESIFDVGYLLFALAIAAGSFIRSGSNAVFMLCGALALVLGTGDAFHLVPRVRRALTGGGPDIEKELGMGLAVSSVSMTVFYIILYYIWRAVFPSAAAGISPVFGALIWASAVTRIIICFFPQNNWLSGGGNAFWSLLRNIVFAITGTAVVILFFLSKRSDMYGLWKIGIAVIISFVCYFPVTIWSKKKPAVGLLMIPKTCAYIWILIILYGMM